MNNSGKLIFLIFFLPFGILARAQEVTQWRGEDRSGRFPETGLLKIWPEAGPAMVWENDAIGNGYGSPVITSKNIFVSGEIDTIAYLFALDLSGKFLWKSMIGREWTLSYPGVRSTPTVAGDQVYATAGLGALVCIDANTGRNIWTVDLVKDFHGAVPRFGFAESVLVDGNMVFCMPGSPDTNVVALDRFTGKTLWISKGAGEIASYCSPFMIRLPQQDILVTFSKTNMLGIDPRDGKVLWTYKQEGQDVDVQANTPFYENGFIYFVNGNGNGAVKLELSADGTTITEIWRNNRCDNITGGFIKVNNYLYSSGYEKRYWFIIDTQSGRIVDSVKFDRGTTNFAEGLLYLYNEKGQMGLFRPDGSKMEMVSSMKITKGTKAHYAHPVICRGILYVRHGRSLLAYDIRQKA